MIKHLIITLLCCTYAGMHGMSLFSLSFKPTVALSLTKTPAPALEESALSDTVKQALKRLDVTYTESDIIALATPATLPVIKQIIKRKRALTALLHKAVDQGDKGAIMEGLENPDIHIDAYYQGETPLTRALTKKRFDIATLLLQKGAHAMLVEKRNGNSPLHLAALAGNVTLVAQLIDTHKADINAKNKKGLSPLFVAQRGTTSKYLYTHPALAATEKAAYKIKYPSPGAVLFGVAFAATGSLFS